MRKNLIISLLAIIPSLFFSVTSQADVTNNPQSIRKVMGNVNKFWNTFSWNELSAAEQKLWGILGWSQSSWENDQSPASDNKYWNQLSKEEQAAASALGYTETSWNKE